MQRQGYESNRPRIGVILSINFTIMLLQQAYINLLWVVVSSCEMSEELNMKNANLSHCPVAQLLNK